MRRSSRVVVAVAAGLLVLTGCSWSKASVAAEVGGTVISTASVDAKVDAIKKMLVQSGQQPATQLATTVVTNQVFNAVVEQAEAAGTLTVPSDVITQVINSDEVLKMLAADPETAGLAEASALAYLSQQSPELNAALASAFAQAKVTFNPRYGISFDPEAGFVPTDNSLSQLFSPAG